MSHGERSYAHEGEYLAIEPPSPLSFTWASEATDLKPTIVTVELFARGDETELVLTHRLIPPRTFQSHRDGWTDIVRKLGEALAGRG